MAVSTGAQEMRARRPPPLLEEGARLRTNAEVGGILLPGAPLTARVTAYAAIASASKLSLALEN